jgi:TonB family protein
MAHPSAITSVLCPSELGPLSLSCPERSVMRKKIVLLAVLIILGANALAATSNEQTNSDRKVLTHVSPVYPELAKKMHIRGIVKVEVIVRPNGTVKSTRVLGGNPVLVNAAEDAVTKWKFEPAQSESTEVVQLTFEGE